jgi:hypothetical protein
MVPSERAKTELIGIWFVTIECSVTRLYGHDKGSLHLKTLIASDVHMAQAKIALITAANLQRISR